MKAVLSRIRLLPAVILMVTLVLGLKGQDLVMSAWAQEQRTAAADVLDKDTAPLPKDPATDDTDSSTPAEVDVLTSLAKRRAVLDARQAELDMRTQVLAATEARIDSKIALLKQLQDQISSLLTQRDAEEKAQIASLVKTYSDMRPRDAARIFNNLSDDILIPVAQAMKPDALAPILAAMDAGAAQRLTEKLASRLKLPDPPAAAAPQGAAAGGPQANAAPTAPTAAAAPPPAAPQTAAR